jgi:hypothetical protein
VSETNRREKHAYPQDIKTPTHKHEMKHTQQIFMREKDGRKERCVCRNNKKASADAGLKLGVSAE